METLWALTRFFPENVLSSIFLIQLFSCAHTSLFCTDEILSNYTVNSEAGKPVMLFSSTTNSTDITDVAKFVPLNQNCASSGVATFNPHLQGSTVVVGTPGLYQLCYSFNGTITKLYQYSFLSVRGVTALSLSVVPINVATKVDLQGTIIAFWQFCSCSCSQGYGFSYYDKVKFVDAAAKYSGDCESVSYNVGGLGEFTPTKVGAACFYVTWFTVFIPFLFSYLIRWV
jgi:hypothetical protein